MTAKSVGSISWYEHCLVPRRDEWHPEGAVPHVSTAASRSWPISVSRIVYQAVVPPLVACEKRGRCNGVVQSFSTFHSLGKCGSNIKARANPTTSIAPPFTASFAWCLVLNPPVHMSGLVVTERAFSAKPRKEGRWTPAVVGSIRGRLGSRKVGTTTNINQVHGLASKI